MADSPSPVRASAQETAKALWQAIARAEQEGLGDALTYASMADAIDAALTAAEARGRQQAEQERDRVRHALSEPYDSIGCGLEVDSSEAAEGHMAEVVVCRLAELEERVQQAEQARDGERMNARQPISDEEARDLQQTSDGARWANAFCRATGFPDEGWALSWFCNAIMAQYDERGRREDATVAALTQALKDIEPYCPCKQMASPPTTQLHTATCPVCAALTGAQATKETEKC